MGPAIRIGTAWRTAPAVAAPVVARPMLRASSNTGTAAAALSRTAPETEPHMLTINFLCKTPKAQAKFVAAAQQAAKTLHDAGVVLEPASPTAARSPAAAAAHAPSTATPPSSSATSNSTPSSDARLGPAFRGQQYMAHLRTASLGQVLLSALDMPSTQTFLQQHGTALGSGCVIVADQQSSGKGRGGNTWVSPAGCLMFSCLWALQVPGTQAPFINYVISLALVRGIQDSVKAVAPRLACPLDVRIKWPNDLYASGLKIGGVLINTSFSQGRFQVVCGVGLNLDNRQPTTCINHLLEEALTAQAEEARVDGAVGVTAPAGGHAAAARSETSDAPRPLGEAPEAASTSGSGASLDGGASVISREVLLACIMNRLEDCFQVFEGSGFGPLQGDYLESWLHTGQRVQAFDPDLHKPSFPPSASPAAGPSSPTMQLAKQSQGSGEGGVWLTVKGLSHGGFLLAVDDWGQVYELTPDGNSFDMMQGLIKRKVPA